MRFPPIPIEKISDYWTQKSLQVIRDWIIQNPSLTGFKPFEISFSAAQANFKYPHKLGFLPKDVITSSIIGPGAVTFNYDKFDSTNLDITVTGQCTVRFLTGTYQGAL